MWNIIVIFCMIFLSGTTAWGSSYEPSNIPSLISSIRISQPVDFCGERVPIDNQGVYEKLEKELLLSVWSRSQVILWMKRIGRYMPYIERTLRQNRMPDDLKYVAIVESSLLPHIGSSKRAIGYWQFIKSTGLRYDLKINSQVDDRRNIFKSTQAAVRYFNKLYGDFGSWTLAAAAYNMGEYGLRSRITKQKTSDFYNLYLPLETQRYIFKIVAVKIILSNPEKYGFQLTTADLYPPVEFDRVQVECPKSVPLQTIAEAAGTYYKTIKELNPELRGQNLSRGNHTIAIPKGAAEDFYARYQMLYDEWQAEKQVIHKAKTVKKKRKRTYVVKRGDNLTSIAAKFKIPLSKLLKWNGLKYKSPLHVGKRLIVSQ